MTHKFDEVGLSKPPDIARYRVEPGTQVRLDQIDARDTGDFTAGKAAGKHVAAALARRLEELQEIFYAQGKHRLLVVLQATDTGGKDSTIRHVFDNVNPQGVRVFGFKKPTEIEQARDYLWRVHQHVPQDGFMTVFNRSHYEEVLVVRVHDLVPRAVWQRRYEHINNFERMLADEGTTIVKFYLHISKEEQRERLQSRIDNTHKHWKFDPNDLNERKRWDDYQAAYTEMLERTSTDYAPWYIVPADRKWFRNMVVAQTLVQTVEGLNPTYPEATADLHGIVVD